jgi:hypothetical protein
MLSSIVSAPIVSPCPVSFVVPALGTSVPTANGVTVAVNPPFATLGIGGSFGTRAVTTAVWLLKKRLLRKPESSIVSPTLLELLATKLNVVDPLTGRNHSVMFNRPAQVGSDAPERPFAERSTHLQIAVTVADLVARGVERIRLPVIGNHQPLRVQSPRRG